MSATMLGVVIGAVSRQVRRVVIADDDSHYGKIVLLPGETLVHLPLPSVSDLHADALAPVIAAHTGVAAPATHSTRCAVIDGAGKVVDVIAADPAIDTMAGRQIVQTDVAGPGWTFIGGVFAAPTQAVVP